MLNLTLKCLTCFTCIIRVRVEGRRDGGQREFVVRLSIFYLIKIWNIYGTRDFAVSRAGITTDAAMTNAGRTIKGWTMIILMTINVKVSCNPIKNNWNYYRVGTILCGLFSSSRAEANNHFSALSRLIRKDVNARGGKKLNITIIIHIIWYLNSGLWPGQLYTCIFVNTTYLCAHIYYYPHTRT